MIWIDADACPVRAEAEAVAIRAGVPLAHVCNGGIRAPAHPLLRVIYVDGGPDEADKRIAAECGPGDVVVTADIPLAARAVEAGALVVKPDGEVLDARNVGRALAARDLMADLRAADPFRRGGGRPFGKADRARFKDALDRALRAASSAGKEPE
ncbi:hypothetical protein BCF33_2223 [Hasllibacter halocynthiae]|uniref:UPF0178 protein BCF33_2223 n=1 Tax=Hasllibacter halocynthiae TaxID=595589 RepID=A0A2T0X377_9RHOB|nr:YaiI/YqxD family protein [Hasllibacter halocynthiae]PRY93355.1 hypothetical protein BCF33_2223 [Hasllibacter halocynthiae]